MFGEVLGLCDHVQMMRARTAGLITFNEPGILWWHIIPESWTPEIVVALGFEDGRDAGARGLQIRNHDQHVPLEQATEPSIEPTSKKTWRR